MNDYEYRIAHLNLMSSTDKKMLQDFLSIQNMVIDSELEYVTVIMKDDRIVASGAVSGSVLKCIAVADDHQGEGLTNRIITDLIAYQYSKNRSNYFIYTHPRNLPVFKQLNFNEIVTLDNQVTLLEQRSNGLAHFLEKLTAFKQEGSTIASIVVNCNPFTNGHRFLIEKASRECDFVHLFVVQEDRSLFPSDVRYRLVCEGVKDLSNVHVHPAGDYIISYATFPSYFYKDSKTIIDHHARLDLKIFAEKIAPVLNICRRYIGHEPYCPVTNHYNTVMKEYLPQCKIKVVEVMRMEHSEKAVSASYVRKLFAAGQYDEIKKLVPETTVRFLMSPEGEKIRTRIIRSQEKDSNQ